jgi:hypothetical protein
LRAGCSSHPGGTTKLTKAVPAKSPAHGDPLRDACAVDARPHHASERGELRLDGEHHLLGPAERVSNLVQVEPVTDGPR